MSSVIGVWKETYDEYKEYKPLIYNSTSGTWRKSVKPYVWSENEWKPIGQANTLMIPFMTSDGEYFYTSDGKIFLVRNHE